LGDGREDSRPLAAGAEAGPAVAAPSFDEVRRQAVRLGLALYALEPGGPVTLEIHSEGEVYSFQAESAEEAFTLAFPPLAAGDVFA
jgi:hypothetical protein